MLSMEGLDDDGILGRARHSRTVGAGVAAGGWGTCWGAKEAMRMEAG